MLMARSFLQACAALLVDGDRCDCARAAPSAGTGCGHGLRMGNPSGRSWLLPTTSQTCPAELPSASAYSRSDKTLGTFRAGGHLDGDCCCTMQVLRALGLGMSWAVGSPSGRNWLPQL